MLYSSTDKIHSFLAKRQERKNNTTCKNKLTLFLTCIIQRVLCNQNEAYNTSTRKVSYARKNTAS